MRQYTGNRQYRGCSYDFRVCAKSMKAVAEIFDTTVYEVKTYYGAGIKLEDDKVFEGIMIVPYGSQAVEALGLERENFRDEMTLERFIERVNEYQNKKYESFKKSLKD